MNDMTRRQVQLAYRLILGRDPDPEGYSHYTTAIENGANINDVCLGMLDSREASKRNLTVAMAAGSIFRATNGSIIKHPRWRQIIQSAVDQELRGLHGRGIAIEALDRSSFLIISHLAETMISGFFHIFEAPGRSNEVRVLRNGSAIVQASGEVVNVVKSKFGPFYAQLRFVGLTTSRVDWRDGEFEFILADEINTWRFARAPLQSAEPEAAPSPEPPAVEEPTVATEAKSDARDSLDQLVSILHELDPDTRHMVAEIVAVIARHRRVGG